MARLSVEWCHVIVRVSCPDGVAAGVQSAPDSRDATGRNSEKIKGRICALGRIGTGVFRTGDRQNRRSSASREVCPLSEDLQLKRLFIERAKVGKNFTPLDIDTLAAWEVLFSFYCALRDQKYVLSSTAKRTFMGKINTKNI